MRVEDVDEILSSQARLAVMASLITGEPLSFSELKAATGLADGNLHVQTKKLASAGYLTIRKQPSGQRTRTSFAISEEGSIRFRLHVQRLQEVLDSGQGVIRPLEAHERKKDDSMVW